MEYVPPSAPAHAPNVAGPQSGPPPPAQGGTSKFPLRNALIVAAVVVLLVAILVGIRKKQQSTPQAVITSIGQSALSTTNLNSIYGANDGHRRGLSAMQAQSWNRMTMVKPG